MMEHLIGLLISLIIVVPVSYLVAYLMWEPWYRREKQKIAIKRYLHHREADKKCINIVDLIGKGSKYGAFHVWWDKE